MVMFPTATQRGFSWGEQGCCGVALWGLLLGGCVWVPSLHYQLAPACSIAEMRTPFPPDSRY